VFDRNHIGSGTKKLSPQIRPGVRPTSPHPNFS
jgi:hypothetical protein